MRATSLFSLVLVMCAAGLPFDSYAQSGFTHHDFGYNVYREVGSIKPDITPKLLVILAEFTDPTKPAFVHRPNYYGSLIFPISGNTLNSFYMQNSGGNRLWLPAVSGANVLGPYVLQRVPEDTAAEVIENVLEAAEADFDFSAYDFNGDGIITADELTILIIDNWTEHKGASRFSCHSDNDCVEVSDVEIRMPVALAGHRASLMTIIHEVGHTLGAVDLYGATETLNFRLSVMCSTVINADDFMGTWHFDPWHKMAFGWNMPKIIDMRGSGVISLASTASMAGSEAVILFDPDRGTQDLLMVEYRSIERLANQENLDNTAAGNGVAIWRVRLTEDRTPGWYSVSGPKGDFQIFALGYPNLNKGDNALWRRQSVTQAITWADGSNSATHIFVRRDSPQNHSATISWFNTNLREIPVAVQDIAVSGENTVFVLDLNGRVCRLNHGELDACIPDITATSLSAEIFGDVWFTSHDGSVHVVRKGQSQAVQVSGCMHEVAAGASSKTVWGLGCRDQGSVGQTAADVGVGGRIVPASSSDADPRGHSETVAAPGTSRVDLSHLGSRNGIGLASHIGFAATAPVADIPSEIHHNPARFLNVFPVYEHVNNQWVNRDFFAKKIAVEPSGRPWVIDFEGRIFVYENGQWQSHDGCAMDISVDKFGTPWIVGCNQYRVDCLETDKYGVVSVVPCADKVAGNEVKVWDATRQDWVDLRLKAKRIAVGPRGHGFWIIDEDGFLLTTIR